MNRKLRGHGGIAVAALGLAGIAMAALAQTPSPAEPDAASQVPGYGMMGGDNGMMGGSAGMGPGMMGGWGGQGLGEQGGGRGATIADRLAALKGELNITSGEMDAWNTYTAAVTAAHDKLWDGMKSVWQPAASGAMTSDQRFDAMNKMIALMRQSYDQNKDAAAALMPHLTPYQQGQASEILPGLAAPRGGHGYGPMWGGMSGGW